MAADDAPESFTESLPERTASDEPVPPSRRDEPEGPPSRLASEVRAREGTLRCTLAALGSWLITVAPLVVTGWPCSPWCPASRARSSSPRTTASPATRA